MPCDGWKVIPTYVYLCFGALEALVPDFEWLGGQSDGKYHSSVGGELGNRPVLKEGWSLNASYLVQYLLGLSLRVVLLLGHFLTKKIDFLTKLIYMAVVSVTQQLQFSLCDTVMEGIMDRAGIFDTLKMLNFYFIFLNILMWVSKIPALSIIPSITVQFSWQLI